MKLFGGKRNSQHTGDPSARAVRRRQSAASPKKEERSAAAEDRKTGKRHKLTGLQRGLLLLAASICVLALVLFGVYKALVRPMERPSQPTLSDDGQEEDGTTVKRPSISYVDDDGNTVEASFEAPGSYVDGVYNILLLGTDESGLHTDTMIIAHLDTTDHSVAMLSVPRDTLIYGNYSVPKLNSVYGGDGEEGVERLEEMLATMLGFQVDGYVLVDLQAFVDVVNIMGGVTFYVPQRMYYSDPTQNLYIDLYEGEQTLDGEQAMELVRYRGYGAADIRRGEVQRDFLQATAQQLLSLKTITKIQPIIETCITYVQTDLTLGNILYFCQELLKCDLSQMESFTLPGEGVWMNGGSYYSPYVNQTLEIINEYFNPYDTDISLSSLHLRTYSGSSSSSSSGGSSGSSSSGSSGSSSSGNSGTSTGTDPAETTDPSDPNGAGALEPTTPDGTDPGATDPGTTDPGVTEDPGADNSGTTDPGTDGSGTADPGSDTTTETDPGTSDSGTAGTDPGTAETDPGATDPGTAETDPGTTDPGTDEPSTTPPEDTSGAGNDGSAGVGILDPGTGSSSEGTTASELTA